VEPRLLLNVPAGGVPSERKGRTPRGPPSVHDGIDRGASSWGECPIPLPTRKQKLPPERKCGGQEPDRSPPSVYDDAGADCRRPMPS
jgi:hypothetical protein